MFAGKTYIWMNVNKIYVLSVHVLSCECTQLVGTFICTITTNNDREWRHTQGVKRAIGALSPAHGIRIGV